MAINVRTLNALLKLEDRDFGKILDRAMAGAAGPLEGEGRGHRHAR